MRVVFRWACLLLGVGCVATRATPREAMPNSEPPPPVAPPAPGLPGCLESEVLKSYVLALQADHRKARAAALQQVGAREDERPARFAGPGEPSALDQISERDGVRFAVVAQIAGALPPTATVATLGSSVHRIEERPRAHAVSLFVCGTSACPNASLEQARVAPLLVPLRSGETLGPPLTLSYDFWWPRVTYSQARRCAPAAAAVP
jgi:hypothetical protein